MSARLLAMIVCGLVLTACAPEDTPPPRAFMSGGMWMPAAMGNDLSQFSDIDAVERVLQEAGHACVQDGAAATKMRCERTVRWPLGSFVSSHAVEFEFRKNGALAAAKATCAYALLGVTWTCTPHALRGAVYPDIAAFASTVESMLMLQPPREIANVRRLPTRAPAPLPSSEVAADRLLAWRFACDPLVARATVTFSGNRGDLVEMHCRQSSLRDALGIAQRQDVVVRYDTADLAVVSVTAWLDDRAQPLSQALHTRHDATLPTGAPPPAARPADVATGARGPSAAGPLLLTARNGERIEMPRSAIGSGSSETTREGFAALTPESQARLVEAYVDKTAAEWATREMRLSYAGLPVLDWYGPDALPFAEALLSDARPLASVALLRHLCLDRPQRDQVLDSAQVVQAMTECLDRHRAGMPRTMELMDRLLAENLRPLVTSKAGALNAFLDFRRDVVYAIALRPDSRATATALAEVVVGKEAELEPHLVELVSTALTPRAAGVVAAPR